MRIRIIYPGKYHVTLIKTAELSVVKKALMEPLDFVIAVTAA